MPISPSDPQTADNTTLQAKEILICQAAKGAWESQDYIPGKWYWFVYGVSAEDQSFESTGDHGPYDTKDQARQAAETAWPGTPIWRGSQ